MNNVEHAQPRLRKNILNSLRSASQPAPKSLEWDIIDRKSHLDVITRCVGIWAGFMRLPHQSLRCRLVESGQRDDHRDLQAESSAVAPTDADSGGYSRIGREMTPWPEWQ
jgi:hypothetical protein